MFELFRMITLRPPQKTNKPGVSLETQSNYQGELADAKKKHSRTTMIEIAQRYSQTGAFVHDPASAPFSKDIASVFQAITEPGTTPSLSSLEKAVKKQFGKSIEHVVNERDFGTVRTALADTFITILLVPTLHRSGVLLLADILRTMALLARAAAKDPALNEAGAVEEALARTLTLPSAIFPLPTPATGASATSGGTSVPATPSGLSSSEIHTAINKLQSVQPEDVALPPRVFINNPQATPEGGGGVNAATRSSAPRAAAHFVESLPTGVAETLTKTGIDLRSATLPQAMAQLVGTLRSGRSGVLLQPEGKVVQIGNQYYQLPLPPPVQMPPPGPPPVPTSHGDVKPVGVADLLVIRQNLKRYEPADVSYIENVLKSEKRERKTDHTKTLEQTVVTETSKTEETERDLQTTERFDLKREVDNTVKEDLSVKAGVAATYKYGSMLEIKANVDTAYDKATEEATKFSTSYSKDVTNRAVDKVTTQLRQQQTIRSLETFEEIDTHGFDNTNGTGNISGVYQWVDRVYEAQVFNYGKRVMFDFMVPEPAAFYLDATTTAIAEGDKLDKPEPFTATPDDLQPPSYEEYLTKYGVTGVDPPPEPFVTVSKTFKNEGDWSSTKELTDATDVTLPDGYRALSAGLGAMYNWKQNPADVRLNVVVGEWATSFQANQDGVVYFPLANQVEALPVTIETKNIYDYVVSVQVNCALSDRAMRAWQHKTHATIMTAYLKKLSDYEEKLGARQAQQAAQQAVGNNPDVNRKIERVELKKSSIAILTAQQYDLFGAIDTNGQPSKNYPQPNVPLAEAQGSYIRFFEQAFEWDQMMYFFYPYYWGRKSNWYTTALLSDNDPLFTDFLTAGEARVVIPVRPGFEDAVGYFLETGLLWNGADLPTIGSPTYLSIIDEIKESQGAPGAETPQGDPWDVHVPTQLVKLRKDDSLPEWKKDDSGSWVPAN